MKPSIPSKLNLKDHAWYFGVYANMARHNVYKVLTEISIRSGIAAGVDESSLTNALVIKILNPAFTDIDLQYTKGNRSIKQWEIIELLNKHFPFLKALNKTLDAANPSQLTYYNVICEFIQELNQVRNQYSHAIYTTKPFSSTLFKFLDWIFDDGLKLVVERLKLKEEDVKHLRRNFGKNNKTNKIRENPGFFHKSNNNNVVTEKGLAFFICLFLEKEYAQIFLKKLNGFKKGDDSASRATLDLYSVYAMRIPQPRLSSEGPDSEALLLDMLNELQRCPQSLYDLLDKSDKKIFEHETESSVQQSDELGEESQPALLRKDSRFPYFALRYIDAMKIFETLRFHIDLGNYHFHSYEQVINSKPITRRWEKKILSFGKLSDFEKRNLPDSYINISKDPASITDDTPAPFIINTIPHYHFTTDGNGDEGNSIGIKEILDKSTKFPELKVDTKPATDEPDYYIATDELIGLLFYDFLVKGKGKRAEEIINSFKRNSINFLTSIENGKLLPIPKEKITIDKRSGSIARLLEDSDFKNEVRLRKDWLASELERFHLEPHQVPEKIIKFLIGIEPIDIQTRAENIIKYYIEETQNLLNRVEGRTKTGKVIQNKKSLRKKDRRTHLTAGDNALFLSKDLIFLQPTL